MKDKTKNKSEKKMSSSQLEGWLAIRKKCSPMKSKKQYSRKEKHKNKIDFS